MGKRAAIERLLRRARGEGPEAEEEATNAPEASAPNDAQEVETGPGGGDGFDLEAGIAAIFESIRSGDANLAAGELPEDTGATYDLLSRLNQLWQSPGQGAA